MSGVVEECQTCRFWKLRGDCRRYPPTLVHTFSAQTLTRFPTTGADHWCGEWSAQAIESAAVGE